MAGDDVELGPYMSIDLEKSGAMSYPSPSTSSTIPPEYLADRNYTSTSLADDPYSPSYTFHSLAEAEAEASRRSLRTASEDHISISEALSDPSILSAEVDYDRSLRNYDSRDRIYVSDSFHHSTTTRPPSPAPFADVAISDFHRPFTPPSVYPLAQPHPGQRGITDTIMITVQSESRDAL